MTISSRIHVPWGEDGDIKSVVPSLLLPSENLPYALLALFFLAVVTLSIHQSTTKINNSYNNEKYPLLNPKAPWEFSTDATKLRFHADSAALIREGANKYPGKPFRVLTLEYDEVLVLPSRYANEIKNDKRFNFSSLELKRLNAHLPGFQPWKMFGQENKIIQHIVLNNLTQSLPKISGPLSKECEEVLGRALPNDGEWHTIPVKDVFVDIVARVATLAFLGTGLAHNEEWIQLAINYTVVTIVASHAINKYPPFLRRFANAVLPECRALRASVRHANRIVEAELAKRRQRDEESGEKHEYNDVLEWFGKSYNKLGGANDPTSAQLVLSFVAIHTTTDLLSEVLLDLAEHQDLFAPLREEIKGALGGGQGMTKAAVHHMKLLDSVMKETQRMKPIQNIMMERRVMEDTTLSGDVDLKRDNVTFILSMLRDPEVYDKPDEYDGRRFYRLRQQPGKQNTSQLVTTSAEYLAFGHGMSACPGRFFAAQEIKIILCQLLAKYEWKMPDGVDKVERLSVGNSPFVNPEAKISIRRRSESEEDKIVW